MSKKKSIEEFVRDHRDAFDDLKAPSRVWPKIIQETRQVVSWWKLIAIAASILLLISVGYIIRSETQPGFQMAGWDEYLATEKYYEMQIKVKMDQIKTLQVGDEVLADIKILDDVYQDLKTQLIQYPNADGQILLSAMIRRQKQKLEVMEEILNRFGKYKNHDHEGHQM